MVSIVINVVRKMICLYAVLHLAFVPFAQMDTLKKEQPVLNADDPANFLTRIEVFNEYQHYQKTNLNQTVFRNIFKIGKRFTTRIDVPLVYNSRASAAGYNPSGLGDISFRLLGYKIIENPLSAFTVSLEISLNTAENPFFGTGKNLVLPVISYSRFIPKKKILLSVSLQQTNVLSGEKERANINFSKLQIIFIKSLSKKWWVVLAPEWFLDYENGGLSMNLRSRLTYAPTPRINVWVTPSAGLFGNFIARYQWSFDFGARYYLLKDKGK